MTGPDLVHTGEHEVGEARDVCSLLGRRPAGIGRCDVIDGGNVLLEGTRNVDVGRIETLVWWGLSYQRALAARHGDDIPQPYEILERSELIPCGRYGAGRRLVRIHPSYTAWKSGTGSEVPACEAQSHQVGLQIGSALGLQAVQGYIHHLRRSEHVAEELRTDREIVRSTFLLHGEPGFSFL